VEGYAVAERSYQGALDWARNRVQGRPAAQASATPLSIIHHPDVRRMLLTMKSHIEAMRYLTLYTASQLDRGTHHENAGVRQAAKARGEFLIPIVKGWCTETGLEMTSVGIQVHGGMGFIEETGAAQPMRDVRISTIYEGTTGIQALDLIGRKLAKDGGAAFAALAADIHAELAGYAATAGAVGAIAAAADAAVGKLQAAVAKLLTDMRTNPALGNAVAVPLLRMAGLTLGAWLHARAAARASGLLNAKEVDRGFLQAKVDSARFYVAQLLPQATGLAQVVNSGAAAVIDFDANLL
jgi:3-(methylthio)propanoyl-CoA dehydrogenase